MPDPKVVFDDDNIPGAITAQDSFVHIERVSKRRFSISLSGTGRTGDVWTILLDGRDFTMSYREDAE